jgi:hypothetical protein
MMMMMMMMMMMTIIVIIIIRQGNHIMESTGVNRQDRPQQ